MGEVRVLVVDDEPSLVATISYNLRREGYEVLAAAGGELAPAKTRRGPESRVRCRSYSM